MEAVFSENSEANQEQVKEIEVPEVAAAIPGKNLQQKHHQIAHIKAPPMTSSNADQLKAKRPNIFAQKSRTTISLSSSRISSNIFAKKRNAPLRETRNSEYFGDNDEDLPFKKASNGNTLDLNVD